MHAHVMQSTHAGMQKHAKSRGSGWPGACPPGNFVNLHFLRLNLRTFLMICITPCIKSGTELLYLTTFVLFYFFVKVGGLSPLVFKSGGAIALLLLCL